MVETGIDDGNYLAKVARRPLPRRLGYASDRVALDAMVELLMLIQQRSEEEGDCLLWTGASCTRGPVVTIKQMQYPLRRLVWEAKHGEPFPAGSVTGVSCKNHLCLEHVIDKTWSEHNSRPTSLTHRIRTAMAKRKDSKLSDAAVAEIRASGERADVLAERHGISTAYVYMIRRGYNRRDYANPFAGLVKEVPQPALPRKPEKPVPPKAVFPKINSVFALAEAA